MLKYAAIGSGPAAIGTLLLAIAGLGCRSDPRIMAANTPKKIDADTALAKKAGIMAKVSGEAWDAFPARLGREVTPIRVTIENEGDEPIRMHFSDMFLVDESGERYHALPIFELNGSVYYHEPVAAPEFAYRGFYVAPHYADIYPGLPHWPGAHYAYDFGYYDHYWGVTWQVELPTAAMIRKALPEGVLDPGGRVSGFVYFEHVGEIDADRLRFVYTPREAGDDQAIARLTVPFRVEG